VMCDGVRMGVRHQWEKLFVQRKADDMNT